MLSDTEYEPGSEFSSDPTPDPGPSPKLPTAPLASRPHTTLPKHCNPLNSEEFIDSSRTLSSKNKKRAAQNAPLTSTSLETTSEIISLQELECDASSTKLPRSSGSGEDLQRSDSAAANFRTSMPPRKSNVSSTSAPADEGALGAVPSPSTPAEGKGKEKDTGKKDKDKDKDKDELGIEVSSSTGFPCGLGSSLPFISRLT